MSLIEGEGVNLEKLEGRVKGDCEGRYKFTGFGVTRDDLLRQLISMQSVRVTAAQLNWRQQPSPSSAFFPGCWCCWKMLIQITLSTHCSQFWSLAQRSICLMF